MSTLEGLTVYDDVRMAKLMHRSMSCPLHADLMKNLRKIICQKWGERYSHVLSNTVYCLVLLQCYLIMYADVCLLTVLVPQLFISLQLGLLHHELPNDRLVYILLCGLYTRNMYLSFSTVIWLNLYLMWCIKLVRIIMIHVHVDIR